MKSITKNLNESVLSEDDYPVKAYKFSESAIQNRPDILQGLTPNEFLKLEYENEFNFGLDNLQRLGCYRMRGWSFDFTPFMKQYLVKQYDSWQEYYAPNKTLLRKSIYGKIDKIVEIK